MSCGFFEMYPQRLEMVYGAFITLRKQLEDEEKERKKQEEQESGNVDVNNVMGQANSMMSNAKTNIPNVGSMSKPSMPSMPSMPSI